MALSNQLLQYVNKPSGVYSIVDDRSAIENNSTIFNQIPLIVGFSKKGVFNKPVFIDTRETFINMFGKIDRNLEKQGSFFHRSSLELLNEGPILALNLYSIKNDIPTDITSTSLNDENYDLTEFNSYSTSPTGMNSELSKGVYSTFFDTKKYWEASKDKLQQIDNRNLISFVNLGQSPVSILMVKNTDITGFDITAREWFDTDEKPEWLHDDDKIKDYFVTVVLLKGDYTNYTKLSNDRVFHNYFDENGLITSKLQAFLNDRHTNIINTYNCSLIPEFVDKDGYNYDFETVINSDFYRTGVITSFNEDLLDETTIDLVGHNKLAMVDNGTLEYDYLSYKGSLVDYKKYHLDRTVLKNNVSISPTSINLTIPNNTNDLELASIYDGVNDNQITVNSSMKLNFLDTTLVQETHTLNVVSAKMVNTSAVIEFSLPWDGSDLDPLNTSIDDGVLVSIINNLEKLEMTNAFSNSNGVMRLTLDESSTGNLHDFYSFAWNNSLDSGDKITVDLTDGTNNADLVLLEILNYTKDEVTKEVTIEFDTFDFVTNGLTNIPNVTIRQDGPSVFKLTTLSFVLDGDVKPFYKMNAISVAGVAQITELLLNSTDKLKIGDYVLSSYDNGQSRFTQVETIVNNNGLYTIAGEDSILLDNGKLVVLKEEQSVNFNLHKLNGFTLKKRMLPNNTNNRINEIYDVLTTLENALGNKRNIQFRYIVDTFNGGIQQNSKYQLSSLAKKRGDCVAICNMASITELENSQDPYFKNTPINNIEGDLNLAHLSTGGNLELNPSYRYTLPSTEMGGVYSVFFGPNIIIRERNKNISVPPAMYVAKLTIRKHFDYKVSDAIAGERRGILYGANIVGLEEYFSDDERVYLEQFGVNPILLDDNIGLVIKSDLTAKQTPKSSLSSFSSVETLIFTQKRLETILRGYLWETNNAQNRLEMRTLVENELRELIIDGALYNASVQMDESNNTGEVIDNLLGVIDVSIELSKKFKSIVNRIKIFNTGEIQVGLLN